MKEGWRYKKLGEVCETLNGLWKGKKPPFVNVGVIRNANFTKDFTLRFDNIEYLDVEERQYSKRKLQKGDLIVEKSGGSEKQPVGRAVLFDKENGEFSFSNFTSVLRIRDKNTFLCEFLYKYLLFIYKRGDTSAMQKATTGIHNIEFEKYLNIDIPCIPLSEQHSIVSRLDSAFSHIDALKANAEKQLNEARKLFQAELTECMKPKEGWEEKTLKEVGITQTGTTPPKSDTSNYGEYISFIRPAELNFDGMGGINYESEIKLSEKGVERSRLIKANSILMCCIGSVGKMGFSTKEVTCNQQINTITPKSNYSPKFVYYAMLDKKFLDDIIKEAKSAQATLPIISKGKWERHKIHVPYLVEQHSIVSHLDSLSSTIRKLEELQQKTIAECDALKQAMLREVFE